MTVDTNVQQIVINKLTQAQFDSLQTVNANELYAIVDEPVIPALSDNANKYLTNNGVQYVWDDIPSKVDRLAILTPTTATQYAGKIVQYTGETTENYVNGYFYKSEGEISTHSWVEFETSSVAGTVCTCSVEDFKAWLETIDGITPSDVASGSFGFYSGTPGTGDGRYSISLKDANGQYLKSISDTVANLEAAGFSFSPYLDAQDGLSFTCGIDEEVVTYYWKQVDVQPRGADDDTVKYGVTANFNGNVPLASDNPLNTILYIQDSIATTFIGSVADVSSLPSIENTYIKVGTYAWVESDELYYVWDGSQWLTYAKQYADGQSITNEHSTYINAEVSRKYAYTVFNDEYEPYDNRLVYTNYPRRDTRNIGESILVKDPNESLIEGGCKIVELDSEGDVKTLLYNVVNGYGIAYTDDDDDVCFASSAFDKIIDGSFNPYYEEDGSSWVVGGEIASVSGDTITLTSGKTLTREPTEDVLYTKISYNGNNYYILGNIDDAAFNPAGESLYFVTSNNLMEESALKVVFYDSTTREFAVTDNNIYTSDGEVKAYAVISVQTNATPTFDVITTGWSPLADKTLGDTHFVTDYPRYDGSYISDTLPASVGFVYQALDRRLGTATATKTLENAETIALSYAQTSDVASLKGMLTVIDSSNDTTLETIALNFMNDKVHKSGVILTAIESDNIDITVWGKRIDNTNVYNEQVIKITNKTNKALTLVISAYSEQDLTKGSSKLSLQPAERLAFTETSETIDATNYYQYGVAAAGNLSNIIIDGGSAIA